LAHLDYLEGAIGRLSDRINEAMIPFAIERDLLATIPGVADWPRRSSPRSGST